MKLSKLIAIAGLVLLPSFVARAEEAKGPPPPAPSKELDAYVKGFLGNWKCETTFPPGAMGPGSPEMKVKSTVTFKKDLGGFFYRGDYKVAKTKTFPGMSATFYLGYDPGSKQLINLGLDSMGGAGMGTGAINGNSAEWSGEAFMMGKKVKTRETMTLTSPKVATHKAELDMGQGFQSMGTDECKK